MTRDFLQFSIKNELKLVLCACALSNIMMMMIIIITRSKSLPYLPTSGKISIESKEKQQAHSRACVNCEEENEGGKWSADSAIISTQIKYTKHLNAHLISRIMLIKSFIGECVVWLCRQKTHTEAHNAQPLHETHKCCARQ